MNFTATTTWIRERDPSRPVHYERAELGPNTDIFCPMYARIPEIVEYAETHDDRPLILCEYSHAMGNSNGNLADYWEAIYAHERLQGGFIWDWVDQGLRQPVPGKPGEFYFAYGGAFEPEGVYHDDNFLMNGLVSADRVPHPGLLEVKKVYQSIKVEQSEDSRGSSSKSRTGTRSSILLGSMGSGSSRAMTRSSTPVGCRASTSAPECEAVAIRCRNLPTSGRRVLARSELPVGRRSTWADRGHEVAWEQFELDVGAEAPRLDRPP